MRLSIAKDGHFVAAVDVVDAGMSVLMGLQDVKREKLLDIYLDEKLQNTSRGCSVPITYQNGHTFII